jgi:hypothetical protein
VAHIIGFQQFAKQSAGTVACQGDQAFDWKRHPNRSIQPEAHLTPQHKRLGRSVTPRRNIKTSRGVGEDIHSTGLQLRGSCHRWKLENDRLDTCMAATPGDEILHWTPAMYTSLPSFARNSGSLKQEPPHICYHLDQHTEPSRGVGGIGTASATTARKSKPTPESQSTKNRIRSSLWH